MRLLTRTIIYVVALLWIVRPAAGQVLPTAAPREVGLSAEKLGRLGPAVQKLLDNKHLAGAVTIVARRGKVVQFEAYGMRDLQAKKPMQKDTIFRIYSMTKPIVSVAVMMLCEEGKLKLDAPVWNYIPAARGMKLTGGEKAKEMTVRDLLRHTAGFPNNVTVDRIYRKAGLPPLSQYSLKEMMEKVGSVRLIYQPGTSWYYSFATDVLSRLIEIASGRPLDQFLAERIFQPLGMTDTGFHVPKEKRDRFAAVHGRGLKVIDGPQPGTSGPFSFEEPPKFLSGGGGLVSTAADYMRFCLMLAGKGALDGKRLLKAETVEQMTRNQLPKGVGEIKYRPTGRGFGLGFAVRIRRIDSAPSAIGEYGWLGGGGTKFWISPRDELVAITLSQQMPMRHDLDLSIKRIVYGAIDDGKPKPPQEQNHPDAGPVRVGLQKQLFVDGYIVAKKENVTLEVGQARKYGVVMKPTLVTDFQSGEIHEGPDGGHGFESHFCWFFSPHWDAGMKRFRLWYMGSKRKGTGLAYAESKDGVKWTKPMVSRDGKSNLVNWKSPVPVLRRKRAMDLLDIGLDGAVVTIDPSLPYGSPEKYKVAFYPNMGGADCRTRLGYSSDGINWKLYNKGYPVTGRAADTNNQIHWNPLTKKYLLHCRQDFEAGGGRGELRGVRIMEHTKGNDLINHPTAWKTLTTFALQDPDKALIPGTKTPVYQIHTFPMWCYEGVWFGLTDILAATNQHLKKGAQDYHKRHDRGVWEFYMAPSRDGIKYDFNVAAYPRKPLIPRGRDGSFDKDCVRPPSNIITHKDQHWIYYLATNERWGCHKWFARLALAKLRLDGFFYLEAGEKPGSVITKPFKLEGGKLQVNINATDGYVKVDLLDAAGEPIAGFSGDAAVTYRRCDNLRLEPKWRNQADLSALKGKVVRIGFHLKSAKLYAFQIK